MIDARLTPAIRHSLPCSGNTGLRVGEVAAKEEACAGDQIKELVYKEIIAELKGKS